MNFKNIKNNKNHRLILVIFAVFCPLAFNFAFAATDSLPEIMVGQTTLKVNPGAANEKVYYGGVPSNEAIMNYNPSGQAQGRMLSPSAVFNGTSSYVDAGTSPDVLGTDPYSYSVWVKRNRTSPLPSAPGDGWASNEYVIAQAKNGFSDSVLFFKYDDTITFRVYGTSLTDGNGHCNVYVNSGSTKINYNDNTWHHIVAIRDNVGTVKGQLWIDGVNVTHDLSGGVTSLVQMKSTDPLAPIIKTNIGREDYEAGSNHYGYFKGNISAVRIYDKALSSTEISNLYAETNVPTNPKLYLKLDDGASSIKDYSPNNYSGITMSSPNWSDDGPQVVPPSYDTDDLFGFSDIQASRCINGIVFDSSMIKCLVANSSGQIRVMSTRTYYGFANEMDPIAEVAALYYPDNSIMGDTVGDMGSNFAYWGRNTSQGSTSSDAAWKQNGVINTNAQANMTSAQFDSYKSKIDAMAGEATPTIFPTNYASSWVLNNDSTTGSVINTTVANSGALYPEGRVWLLDCTLSTTGCTSGGVTFIGDHTYTGKGTIIVKGNLTFGSNVGITKSPSDPNARLGIIVLDGDVTFAGGNDIDASILCYGKTTGGTIAINGSNSNFTGSFVAKSFSVVTGNNIRFYYDYDLDGAWPPGFKYFSMPTPANK